MGLMRAKVHLERPRWDDLPAAPPWKTTVNLGFDGVRARYEGLPYRLDGIRGRVAITDDRIDLDRLTGWHGRTRVMIDGAVDRLADGGQRLDVALSADSLAIDEALLRALPSSSRAMLDHYGLGGLCDLSGRLWRGPGDARLRYELDARMKEAWIHPERFRYRLDSVSGLVHLTPTVAELAG